MSILYLGEKFDRPVSETEANSNASRVFQFQTTEKESGVAVLQDSNLPLINSLHPDNVNLVCKNRSADPETDADTWLVTCSYEKDTMTYKPDSGEEKPWDLPPYNISYGAVGYNKVLKKAYGIDDTQGNPSTPVLNSVEDPFDPPLEYVKYNNIMKFSYNKRYFTLNTIKEYQGTINKININVLDEEIEPENGRINSLAAVKIDVNDEDGDFLYSYYQIDVEIELSEDGFNSEPLDQGFYYLKSGTTRTEIKLSDAGVLGDEGEAVTEPAKLDGSGGLVSGGGTPYYFVYRSHFPADWTTLDLPKLQSGKRKNSNLLL